MRRVLSLFMYIIAGTMLVFLQIIFSMAFHESREASDRVIFIPMLMFALVPLLVGLALHPGPRMRTAGSVLMTTAGIGAALCALLWMTAVNPDMQDSFEPRRRLLMSGWGLVVTTLPMGVVGLLLRSLAGSGADRAERARIAARLQADR